MTKDENDLAEALAAGLGAADESRRASMSSSTTPFGGGLGTSPINQMAGTTAAGNLDMNAAPGTTPIDWNLGAGAGADDENARQEREARHRADDASFRAFRSGHVVSPGHVSGLGFPAPNPERKA